MPTGGKHSQTIGTRAQVWHGTAKKTSGGLNKNDLMMNKSGRIVSRAKHHTAKKEMRLLKHGYGTEKGKFGFVKIGSRKHSRRHRSRKMSGGAGWGSLSPADVGGSYMIEDVVPQTFSPLDRALVGGRGRSRSQSRGRSRGKSMSMVGGGPYGNSLFPGDVDGQGITNYSAAGSVGVQEAAGMAGGRRRRRRGRRGGGDMIAFGAPTL